MDLKIKIVGLQEIDKALNKLPEEVEKKFLFQSLRVGADVILDEQLDLVPEDDGDLADTLAKQRIPTRRNEVGYLIGVRRKMAGSAYAHIVEFGARAHQIVSRVIGKPLGYGDAIFGHKVDIPAQPARSFIRSSMDNKGEAAIAVTGKELWKRISRYWKKNTKQ